MKMSLFYYYFVLIIFVTFSVIRADMPDNIYNSMKIREVRFDINERSSDDFWAWIQFNIDQIYSSQVDMGTRKIDEKIILKTVLDRNQKITIIGNISLLKAVKQSLNLYKCICIIDKNSILIVPDDIKLDSTKYDMIEQKIYKVKQ